MTRQELQAFKHWYNHSGWAIVTFIPFYTGVLILVGTILALFIPPAGGEIIAAKVAAFFLSWPLMMGAGYLVVKLFNRGTLRLRGIDQHGRSLEAVRAKKERKEREKRERLVVQIEKEVGIDD